MINQKKRWTTGSCPLKNPASELHAGSATLGAGQFRPSFSPIAEEEKKLFMISAIDDTTGSPLAQHSRFLFQMGRKLEMTIEAS
jgi:hypothetical protein